MPRPRCHPHLWVSSHERTRTSSGERYGEAEPALQWIGALYEIDRRADGDLARVAELRRAEAPAILDAFKDWLWHQATLKTLAIGKAAAYAVANWSRLTRFVDDARIPLDNNAT